MVGAARGGPCLGLERREFAALPAGARAGACVRPSQETVGDGPGGDRMSTEIVPVAPDVTLGVVHASGPKELVAAATEVANALAGMIDAKKLYNSINGRRYVRVEGWTTLAAMLGCLPREVSVSRTESGTYTATVELARMSDGAILTRASAECGMDEPT